MKTSLAPGSKVVTEYSEQSRALTPYLEALRFQSGRLRLHHLHRQQRTAARSGFGAVKKDDLVVAAVLSGNRNFEGRINPQVKANYLASPPLVVAYALAGRVISIWPPIRSATARRQAGLPERHLAVAAGSGRRHSRHHRRRDVPQGIRKGVRGRQQLADAAGADGRHLCMGRQVHLHQEAAVLREHGRPEAAASHDLTGLRVLAMLGDSITTDHISPAGNIAANSPAGKYLIAQGVKPADFNSYGARRGNHEVMVRGTLANVRLRNQLAPGTEGGVDRASARWRADVHLRRVDEIPAGRHAAADSGGQGIRLGIVARLGGEGRRCCSA